MHDAIASRWTTPTTALSFQAVSPRDVLLEDVRGAVNQVRRSAQLSAKDHTLLSDIARGRYITGVMNALEVSQKCADVADSTAIPEAFMGWTLRFHPRFHASVVDAFRCETDANGAANLAQFEFEIAPTEANRQRAIEALNRQLVETRRALDALHRHGNG